MSLRRYVLKRLLLMIPILFGVTLITFMLSKFLPGDPVQYMLQFTEASPELRQQLRAQYNLDEPVWKQYLLWLKDAAMLDLGKSVISGREVSAVLKERLPDSVLLGTMGFLVAVVVGIPAGIISAVKKGTATDEVSRVFALTGVATPNFFLGLMLLLVFAVQLDWFEVIPPADIPLYAPEMLHFLILPAITLGTASAAIIMRLTRSSMVEELNKDYVRMARAKGLPKRTVILKHVVRNSLISVVTVMALQVAFLVNGTVVIEQVFSWPGLGRVLIGAIRQRDFPIIQAGVLVTAVLIVFANLIADIIYSLLDPRIRY